MLLVCDVRPEKRLPVPEENRNLSGIEKLQVLRSQIPAVTHVDYSARIQTVSRTENPLFYDLISAFDRKTGCPVLINTSFNVRGEPIVHTPDEAYRCFMRTEMDILVIGSYVFHRDEQPPYNESRDWKKEYELD
jgi:carbamoyltransferase